MEHKTLSADSGNISLPRLIYPAVFVEGEHRYVFHNLKGYALFAAKVGQGQEAYTTTCSDLQNVHGKFHTHDADLSVTQTGDADAEFTVAMTDYDLTGTLYPSYLTIMTINQDGIGELKTVEIKG